LELTTASHICAKPGRYIIAGKLTGMFGNDTMPFVPVMMG
jgi:hypothetical protein